MKRLFLLVIVSFSFSTLFGQTKIFKGAWFDIKYPSSFKAKGSLKSSSAEGFESAFFESSDRLVEFYVFSPQWSGVPSDISLKETEKLSSTKTEINGSQITIWWTITAKNGSYIRSYQEKKDESLNINWVVGIKYKNQIAYNKYKTQYSAFKASLKQYAD